MTTTRASLVTSPRAATATRASSLLLLLLPRVPAQLPLPYWAAPFLDPLIFPYGGAELLNGTQWTRLYYGVPGAMNAMAPMLSFLGGAFLATWKLSPLDEDAPGQHVLYSRSTDGVAWLPPATLFPPLNSSESPRVALFAEPSIMLGGRVYAAASPQQFCLYPVQQNPRLLLLRRVYADGTLGQAFWASAAVPDGYANASAAAGVVALPQMDTTTQADVATLTPDATSLPCDTTGATTKCEACAGGCQPWADAFNASKAIENERAHYLSIRQAGGGALLQPGDVILYRSRENRLYASVRSGGPSESWSIPQPTNITDAISNINAGNTPDGSAYLVSNAMIGVSRDPLFIAIARNCRAFDRVAAVGSCGQAVFASPEQPDGCLPRVSEGSISGLQYPQAAAVVAPSAVAGLWIIMSLNREDIWVARVDWGAVAAM